MYLEIDYPVQPILSNVGLLYICRQNTKEGDVFLPILISEGRQCSIIALNRRKISFLPNIYKYLTLSSFFTIPIASNFRFESNQTAAYIYARRTRQSSRSLVHNSFLYIFITLYYRSDSSQHVNFNESRKSHLELLRPRSSLCRMKSGD